jgi:hypothetical protein
MRSITFIGTAAAILTVTTLMAVPASADRVCKQECDGGFCRSRCVERSDRLYMYDRDRDYYRHRRGVGVHVPGVDVDIRR